MVSCLASMRRLVGAAGLSLVVSAAPAAATENPDPLIAEATVPAATGSAAASGAIESAATGAVAPTAIPAPAARAMASSNYPVIKRRAPATTRSYRRVAFYSYEGRCTGSCGQHFVLMTGIAY